MEGRLVFVSVERQIKDPLPKPRDLVLLQKGLFKGLRAEVVLTDGRTVLARFVPSVRVDNQDACIILERGEYAQVQ